jgi:mRNA interferase HigB
VTRNGNVNEVRKEFPHADLYGKFVIFNIGGNKYRLIAVIHYNRRKVYVRHVLTHADYSLGKWKYD